MQRFNVPPVVPEGFVKKFYEMNPLEDDLVKGGLLMNGMRVLITDPRFRVDLNHMQSLKMLSEEEKHAALRWNRWMTVTELDTDWTDSYTSFIGLYDDGTKFDFLLSAMHGWYVKMDSMPQPVTEEATDDFLGKLRDKLKGGSTERGKQVESVHRGTVMPHHEGPEEEGDNTPQTPPWVAQVEAKWGESKGTTTDL